MSTLETATLNCVTGHANAFNLQAQVGGIPVDLTGKTITAAITYQGSGSPLALSIGSGINVISAALGQLQILLTLGQVNAMTIDTTAYVYLTVWNADNSQWAYGSFPMVITRG